MAIGTKPETADEEEKVHEGIEGDDKGCSHDDLVQHGWHLHEKVDGIPNENNIPITDERVINNEGGVVGNSTAKCDESGMGVKIKQETVNKKDETRAKTAKKSKKKNKKKSKNMTNPKVDNKTTKHTGGSCQAAVGNSGGGGVKHEETRGGVIEMKETSNNGPTTKKLKRKKSETTPNSKRSFDVHAAHERFKTSKRRKTEEKTLEIKAKVKSQKNVKFSKKMAAIKKKKHDLKTAKARLSQTPSKAFDVSIHPSEIAGQSRKDPVNPSYWNYLENKIMSCERNLTDMRYELERRDHEMKGQMDNMVSLLDARLPLHGPAPFAHHFPYPICPPPPPLSVPAPPQGRYQNFERVNGWSYYPPRLPSEAIVYNYPNLSYHDSSCGAEIQSLSSPDLPQSNAALPQQQGLVQLGDTRRQQSSQFFTNSASPSSSTQQLDQVQCLSLSAESPRLSSQQTTMQPKELCKTRKSQRFSQVQDSSSTESPYSSSDKSNTIRLRKLHHTCLFRSSKCASTDPSSSAIQQSSKIQSDKQSVKHQRKSIRSAKAKKQ
ncbi:uncharacterized protein [Dysidea avara]